jgi:hypothetical protein
MANPLQMAGAASEPSNFAPLNTDRIFTGLWTNRNPLRDAATSMNEAKYYGTRLDSIIGGYNSEISNKLTLRRRPGTSLYNGGTFQPVTRFYSFNTFTLTTETIRVLADTQLAVFDVTTGQGSIVWAKAQGAGPTFFLGVGNILYFTNGKENKQWNYATGKVTNWGIDAPVNAPTTGATNAYFGSWIANVVYRRVNTSAGIVIVDPNGNVQVCTKFGVTGITSSLVWGTAPDSGTTDGGVTWENQGNGAWVANSNHSFGDLIYQPASDGKSYFFQAQTNGTVGSAAPTWLAGINSLTPDNNNSWLNLGLVLSRAQIGDSVTLLDVDTIIDQNGTVQQCLQAGKTGATVPAFSQLVNGYTPDPANLAYAFALWQATGSLGPVQYGYAFENSATLDISNMSPPSVAVNTQDGEEIDVTGDGSADSQVNTIVVYRTVHGGSTFLFDGTIANPGAGQKWTFHDSTLDAGLNATIQAQVDGEGTPLPVGATCLEYHLGRIVAAVDNVVYLSSGPDAVVSGSSGNAGFDTTFTCQSKITRFWTNSLGLIVFTVRDSYIILGDGVTQALYMMKWVENIPLLNYDAFSVFLTTAYLLTGKKMVMMLDPSSGIVEASQPIADLVQAFDPTKAYLTFHSESSAETALYLSDGVSQWYRLASTSAPEHGSNWSTQAQITGGMSAVQSVETSPGQYQLLLGPPTGGGPILARNMNVNTDNGKAFAVKTRFGSIVVAQPGQLAALAWMTLEAQNLGTAPALSVLLSEINGTFENVPRSRQDPPNLPPSQSLYSNRHSLMQNQNPTWCRHFQFEIDWPAEDAANELITFTVFGQTWQEMRSQ